MFRLEECACTIPFSDNLMWVFFSFTFFLSFHFPLHAWAKHFASIYLNIEYGKFTNIPFKCAPETSCITCSHLLFDINWVIVQLIDFLRKRKAKCYFHILCCLCRWCTTCSFFFFEEKLQCSLLGFVALFFFSVVDMNLCICLTIAVHWQKLHPFFSHYLFDFNSLPPIHKIQIKESHSFYFQDWHRLYPLLSNKNGFMIVYRIKVFFLSVIILLFNSVNSMLHKLCA